VGPKNTAISLVAATIALPAHALTPEELYAKLAPSIWFVYGMDSGEKRVSQGSGVVVGPQRVATNCHVIRGASTVFIRKENVLYIAKVEHRDAARDLCQLQVANLAAPAVEVGSSKDVRVGQKVYALGNPQGLEVSLSDGLVSALRGPDGKDPIIQTTAPISQGSSGGGLFNEEGKLVGITTLQVRSGQNLNFAIPAEWVTELGERMKAAEEKKQTQLATLRNTAGASYNPAAPGLPVPGMTWKYRYRDRQFRNEQVYTVKVTGVDGWAVTESFALEGGGSSQTRQTVVGGEELRFVTRELAASRTLIEFAPYLSAAAEKLNAPLHVPLPSGYPADRHGDWNVTAKVVPGARVNYAGNEVPTVRVDLHGTRSLPDSTNNWSSPARFEMRAWYSTETRRLVRVENQVWTYRGNPASDEVIELVEHSGS
jgi:hypothetical protein